MLKKSLSLLLMLCLILSAGLALAEEEDALLFGAFSAENLNGDGPITEANFADAKITLVNYWATWCGPCLSELPDLAQLSALTDGQVQVFGILTDAVTALGVPDEAVAETMHQLIEAHKITYPILMPEEYLMTLGSVFPGIPATLVIDEGGEILNVVIGARSAEQWLEIAQNAASQVYDDVNLLSDSQA